MSMKESMESRIYDLMDWAEIEAVVYAEEDSPRRVLGPVALPDGVLIRAFFPGEENVSVKTASGDVVPMVLEDEAGYFAVMLDRKRIPDYTFVILHEDGTVSEYKDPYAFPCQITEKEEIRFQEGIWDRASEKMGAHLMNINGTEGVYFAVWAPNAIRVSVVGDFNLWDGRRLQMNRLQSGIFELFVPGIKAGSFYKFEIKAKAGLVYLKADPFAFRAQQLPEAASVITNTGYDWKDDEWMKRREEFDPSRSPLAVYECNIGTWMKREDGNPERTAENREAEDGSGKAPDPEEETGAVQAPDRKGENGAEKALDLEEETGAKRAEDRKKGIGEASSVYREIAEDLVLYLKDMGYTHVEFLPVMEYPDDASMGYVTSGFFAPTSRYGTPADFKYLVDRLHQNGLGVLLDWVPGYFARGNDGLASFDGTCLYEHMDPKKGVCPSNNALIFNYGRGEVESFMKSSAMFWISEYHADGLRIPDLSGMLYLNYGRRNGEWIANMYGGNENLENIEFLRNLNNDIRANGHGAITIAEETTGYPAVTGNTEEEGLGFGLKWNNGCIDDYLKYIQLDPLFRGAHQDDLTFSMVYMYTEKFMLALSHNILENGRPLLRMMPGKDDSLKLANLRLTYAYLMMHPGKKLICQGQDFGQKSRMSASDGVDWSELENADQKNMRNFSRALLKFYREQPALYRLDEEPEGFEWISNLDWERNLLVFLRKTEKEEDTLLVVANFSNVVYDNFMVGVPYAGKYKEIFNSDAAEFGGGGVINPRVKLSRAVEQDERKDSIKIKVPPLGVSVFRFTETFERTAPDREEKKPERTSVKAAKAMKKGETEKTGETLKKAAVTKTEKTVKKVAAAASRKMVNRGKGKA